APAAGAPPSPHRRPGGSRGAPPAHTRGAPPGPDAVPTLRTGRPEDESVLTALARLHVRGVRVDWGAVHPAGAGTVELPTYAFQHETYWPDTTAPTVRRTGDGSGDPADAELWTAVERGDATGLAGLLG
ncbi:hypothetical protein ACFV5M_01455, partial [Streptomyces albidoflavus]